MVMIREIIVVGPGKAMGTDSFSGSFGCCVTVAKCQRSGLWRHGLW